MSKLEELLKKRKNLAAKFELPFLSAEQIEDHWAQVKEQFKDLPEVERDAKREEVRSQLIKDDHWLKLVVTRIADMELERVEEKARKKLIGESPTRGLDYVEERRDLLWPTLRRHMTKGVELVDGKWVDADPAELSTLLDMIGLVERGYLVNAYFKAATDDKKAAEADPSFLASGSPKP